MSSLITHACVKLTVDLNKDYYTSIKNVYTDKSSYKCINPKNLIDFIEGEKYYVYHRFCDPPECKPEVECEAGCSFYSGYIKSLGVSEDDAKKRNEARIKRLKIPNQKILSSESSVTSQLEKNQDYGTINKKSLKKKTVYNNAVETIESYKRQKFMDDIETFDLKATENPPPVRSLCRTSTAKDFEHTASKTAPPVRSSPESVTAKNFKLSSKENFAPFTANYNDIDSDHSLEYSNDGDAGLSESFESFSPTNNSNHTESSDEIISRSPTPEPKKRKPLTPIQQQQIQVQQKQQQQQRQSNNTLSQINENPSSPDLFDGYENQEENLHSRQADQLEESHENQQKNSYPRQANNLDESYENLVQNADPCQADHPEENRAEEDPFTKPFPFVDENHEWQPIGSPELIITELKERGIEFNQYSPERNIPKAPRGTIQVDELNPYGMIKSYAFKRYTQLKDIGILGPRFNETEDRYKELENGEIYLGCGVTVGEITWKKMNKKTVRRFARDLLVEMYGTSVDNICLDYARAHRTMENRSPRKLMSPRKYQLYLSLIRDFLNTSPRYKNLTQLEKDAHILKAGDAFTSAVCDKRAKWDKQKKIAMAKKRAQR